VRGLPLLWSWQHDVLSLTIEKGERSQGKQREPPSNGQAARAALALLARCGLLANCRGEVVGPKVCGVLLELSV
jgi:hypothetical protein